MNRGRRYGICEFLLIASWLAVAISFLQHSSALAQQPLLERSYPYLKPQVEQTLRALGAYVGGELPGLDGFVDRIGEPLDRYQRPYYQYSIELQAGPSGKTLVRVTANITAWYSGVGAAHSGYRKLASNGRLENDLFGRLDDALKISASPLLSESKPNIAIDPPSPKLSTPLPAPRSTPTSITPETATSTAPPNSSAPGAPSAAPTDSDLQALRKQVEATKKRRDELSTTVHDLEDILRNQAHPTDLVVVRKSATPVLAQPENTARILFRAEAEDEFEVLDIAKDWAHVQISGASRGWIRRSLVDLPEQAGIGIAAPANNASATGSPELFHVMREETVTFAGNWQPLKGKAVKVVWVQPGLQTQQQTGASAKLSFAKGIFLQAATELAQSPTQVAGVVVVFDSADGGQAAAPLVALERWRSGRLSDAEFWKQVSFDPPEAFQTSPKS